MPIVVTLKIKNNGSTLQNLRLSDPLPEFMTVTKGSATRLISLPKGQTLQWEYTFTSQRGFYNFSGLHAETGDPLGVLVQPTSCPRLDKC